MKGMTDKNLNSEEENEKILTNIILTDDKVAALLRKSREIHDKSPGTIEITPEILVCDGHRVLTKAQREYEALGGEQSIGDWRQYAIYRFLCYVDDMLRIYQIAERVFFSCSPDIVRNEYEIGDLISQAYIGLVEASGRYERGDKGWHACSGLRIRGSIIDSFYKQLSYGEIGKRQMRLKRDIERVRREISSAGDDATPEKIAVALDIKVEKVHKAMGSFHQISSLHDEVNDETSILLKADHISNMSTELSAEIREAALRINTCIKELDTKIRSVLNLIYVHGYKQNRIGEMIGLQTGQIYAMTKKGKKKLLACIERHGLQRDIDWLLEHRDHLQFEFE